MAEPSIDTLLVYYAFADQYGIVDMNLVNMWAIKHLGVPAPHDFFEIKQHHLDLLMDEGAIPDIRPILSKIFTVKPKRSY